MDEYPFNELEEVLENISEIIKNRLLDIDFLNIKPSSINCCCINSSTIIDGKIMIEAILSINPKDINRLKIANPIQYNSLKKCNMV